MIFHFHTNLNPLAQAAPQASPRKIIAGAVIAVLDKNPGERFVSDGERVVVR